MWSRSNVYNGRSSILSCIFIGITMQLLLSRLPIRRSYSLLFAPHRALNSECTWVHQEQSKVPFGTELAGAVADRFWSNQIEDFGIIYMHRDYCGTSLAWKNGKLSFCSTIDGHLASHIMQWSKTQKNIFSVWLARQSDYSLSGHDIESKFYESEEWMRGNQRINEARLREFIRTTGE